MLFWGRALIRIQIARCLRTPMCMDGHWFCHVGREFWQGNEGCLLCSFPSQAVCSFIHSPSQPIIVDGYAGIDPPLKGGESD